MTQAANLGALGTNVNSSGIAQAAGGGTAGTNGAIGFKNRIINGAMLFDQRNNGSSVNGPTSGSAYALDRYVFTNSTGTSKFTIQQNSGNAPLTQGFSQCMKITSTSAYTPSAGDYIYFTQKIEGYNVQDFSFGNSSAKTFTLSFWVNCSVTGTYAGSIINANGDYNYPFTYIVNSANTWEQKSITITGATAGTWLTNSNTGLQVIWNLGYGSNYSGTAGAWTTSGFYSVTGSVNLVATNGATMYLTGVQVELGTAATNFDVRSYGTEFGLCCRYWQQFPNGGAASIAGASAMPLWVSTSSGGSTRIMLPFSMRTDPTATYAGTLGSGGAGKIAVLWSGGWATITGFNVTETTWESVRCDFGLTGVSANSCAGFYMYQTSQTDVRIMLSAEL